MKKTLTTIYSEPSIKELENLIYSFLNTFDVYNVNIDDMFYYGVFCSSSTYANYDWESLTRCENNFEIPFNLYAPCSTSKERIEYVESVIDDVLQKKIQKPEWMIFIEMESSCGGCCDLQPSNYLRLLPKSEKYKALAEHLIDYLYSPNRTTVVY